jgi:hypothetical protein
VALAISGGTCGIHDREPAMPKSRSGFQAGTLILTVQLGSAAEQLSMPIPAAPAGIVSAQGSRTGSTVEVDSLSFNNMRTLGGIDFRFYNSSGTMLSPAAAARRRQPIRRPLLPPVRTWQESFALGASLPVTGNAARFAHCNVTLASLPKAPRGSF